MHRPGHGTPNRSHPRLGSPSANFTGKLSLALCARQSEFAGRHGRGLRVGDSDLPAWHRDRRSAQPEGPSESSIFPKWAGPRLSRWGFFAVVVVVGGGGAPSSFGVGRRQI
jgi:hypothetical protein